MQRGIYFDGWYRGHHCYHPSLPQRRLSQVRDLERYRATMLVWSAMGGGSISLPYLEQEIDGPVSPRDRFYGGLTDREFIAECGQRGIDVYGIVFEAQGWEFGVELNEDETEILAFNELRGTGRRATLGLREFTQNRYPGLWRPFEDYFPEGLVNSAGEKVTDLIEECVARGLDGTPYHARWVESPDADQECFYMDRNNPVWREYLKAIIRLQIDSGVHGVQLDETSTPLGTMQYGACFTRDCVLGFREHLKSLDADALAQATGGEHLDLQTFDYAEYLRALGADPLVTKADTPLFLAYFDYMRKSVNETFNELADYAREYARSQGRTVKVSGNIYNMFPYFNGIIDHVDVVISETRNLTYRQPEWYRNSLGMALGRELVVVENPYGGVIQKLVRDLDEGHGHDAARLLAYEAAAMGANMTLPYGAWMGSIVQDSFSLPDRLATEIQSYLEEIDAVTSQHSTNPIGVLYDIAANCEIALRREIFADNRFNMTEDPVAAPYWELLRTLSERRLCYDAVPANDSLVPAWRFTVADLRRYRALALAGCTALEPWAHGVLDEYVAAGGHVVVVGTSNWTSAAPGVAHVDTPAAAAELLRQYQPFTVSTAFSVGVNTHRVDDGSLVLHLVNYELDEAVAELRPIRDLEVELTSPAGEVSFRSPGTPVIRLWPQRLDGDRVRVVLPEITSHAVLQATLGA
ncbi:hypothetical protein [Jiangella asiatica]|uniref:Beta-galactosidase trimerisation domain-containing protein n=1 Tax=Jiangella asiatica TaxID=2530372 RepID=A0A4R5CP50_9ACTN|nr:hypothetical protein [Jiangella asiatica]TDE01167.1 hypothetical protein E1269_23680 [Jiangella asiatica]